MFQPEEISGRAIPATDDLAAFVIPTSRETTDKLPEPPHGCPETPGRECMIRYLYAQRHHHAVKCATCGQMSGKVSSFKRGAKVKADRIAETGMTAAERKREKNRLYEEGRKAARRAKNAAMTPAELEAQRQLRLENLRRGHETQKLKAQPKTREEKIQAQRDYRAAPKAAKLAAMTPAERDAWEQEKRNRAFAALAKANAANAARREAKRDAAKAENDERVKAKLDEKRRLKNEARSIRDKAKYAVLTAEREPAARASMELVRMGSKPPSRCEAVVLALEWMVGADIKEVAIFDLFHAVNKHMYKKVSNSGALGRSVRDYGLTVKTEYRGNGIKAILYLDDKASAFVSGGYVKHMRFSKGKSNG